MSIVSSVRNHGPTYMYIAGRGHSGSTLLTLLLARHPQVAAVGELANLSLQLARDEKTRWVGLCSCGERPLQCRVWGRVLDEIGDEEEVDFERFPFSWRISDIGMEEEFRHTAFFRVPIVWIRNRFWRLVRYVQYYSKGPIRNLLEFYKPQKKWARNRSKLASKFAAACDVDAIVDASKDPLDMLDVYFHATVPVKIIFLTRDCRGNVWSMLKRLTTGQERDTRVVSAAKEWARVNGRIWRLVQRLPTTSWIQLKYEDICNRPEAVMKNLFEFVGLEATDVVAAFSDGNGQPDQGHTVGGNRIRFTSKKLNIREDKAWRENLTNEELRIIEKITGSLARKLGYQN